MNFKPIPYYKGPSYLYKNRRILWLNSSFNSGFTLIDNKVYDVFFDLPPLQIYKNSNLKVLTYIRDSNQARPIVIKLKDLNFKRNSVINTDNEYYPVIYSNHTGVEGMTFTNNPSIILIPQQIPRITLRLDDNYTNYFNGLFGTITNGEIVKIEGSYDSYLIFKTSGSFVLDKNLSFQLFMIGGGGGGGYNHGGGGGAGAYYWGSNLNFNSGTYSVNVGSGGSGSTTGENQTNGGDTFIQQSSVDVKIGDLNLRCKGGGKAGTISGIDGSPGGCGGGGDGWSNNLGTNRVTNGGATNNSGTVGSGNRGGNGRQFYGSGALAGGGGGGIGNPGFYDSVGNEGSNGGEGLVINIKGTNEVYGGGGGASEWPSSSTAPAGQGGGATVDGTYIRVGGDATRTDMARGGDAVANTGSGGGGGKGGGGGNGSAGIVIIRFKSTNRIEGITANETLVQTTNASIVVNTNSKYVINYQTPVDLPKGTYESIFNNGAITFKSKPDYNYPTTSNLPLIWYKFDNGNILIDSGIAGFNLTNNASTFDSSIFQRGNGSLNIASNSHVEITNTINFNNIQTTNGITFAVWVNLSSSTGRYGRIMHFSNSNQSIAIYILRANLTGELQLGTNVITYTTSGYNFFNNTWNHVVWSISPTGVWNIYINGIKLNVSITSNISNADHNDVKRLGRGLNINDGTDCMVGKLDDFRIYDYVLSTVEIYDLYNGSSDRSYPLLKDANNITINPLVWYKFDTDNLLVDSSGNFRTLTASTSSPTIDNTNFIKGNGSVKFLASSSQFLSFQPTINFNQINVNKGISFSLWGRFTTNTSESAGIFEFGSYGATLGYFILIYKSGTNIVYHIQNGSSATAIARSDFNYFDSNWRHYVWTISTSGIWNIYINGVINQSNFSGIVIPPFNETTNTNFIGKRGQNNLFTDGNIDDFRIYESVLTATQVSELYNGRIGIYSPPSFILGLELEDE